MGDWDTRDALSNLGIRSAIQLRSQSLPRLGSGSVDISSGSNLASIAALTGAEFKTRFQRAARTVADCLTAVKGLALEANTARTFREKCSNLLGAALAATLALQEALSSCKAAGSDLNVQQLATDVQTALLSADTLVRKYGHERIWDSLMRFEAKDDVDQKFDAVISELHGLTNKTWDLIDPQNRIKRDVVSQGAAASSGIKNGNAFSRYSLRPASKHKVQALLAFPDEDGESHDGVVAWAAHRNIKMVQLSSQVTTVIESAGEYLICMAYDKAGYIWTGHEDGTVRIWSLEEASAAGSPVRVADVAVTAVAVDSDTGYCWAGTQEGEVVIIRFKQQASRFGRLEFVRSLLGYDAHSPSAQPVDSSTSSYVSSSQPIRYGNNSSSGTVRNRHHHHRHSSKHRLPAVRSGVASDNGGVRGGLDLLESCLGSASGSSGRLRDTCVHAGPVKAILIAGGRAYTAGGSSGGTAALLVWDSSRCELLRTISKRSTRWCRYPATCITMVCWSNARYGSGVLSPAAAVAAARTGSAASAVSSTVTSGPSSGGATDGPGSSGTSGPANSVTGGPGSRGSDRHLVTGHTNGMVIMWDPSGDILKPVLLIGPEKGGNKQAVRNVLVLDELGVLACGHANGKVYLRKLDPKTRLQPRDDANVPRWNPRFFSLQAHRLGLQHLSGAGHMLVTSGKTGSVKMWPETTIRCLASAAGIQLPHSHNPISEALNALLANAGLTAHASTSLSSLFSPAGSGGRGGSGNINSGSSGASFQQQQQWHQRHRSEGAATDGQVLFDGGNGAAAAAMQAGTVDGDKQQQQVQRGAIDAIAAVIGVEQPKSGKAMRQHSDSLLLQQTDRQPRQQQQQEEELQPGVDRQQPQLPRMLQRNNSSSRWTREIKASWMLDFDSLGLDPNKRRVIGTGSYGRVEVGSFCGLDVAVKILTDVAGGPGSGTPADCLSWDEARLRALKQEVGILSTLRHPNVVLFMGVCLAPPAVVTEYCPLGSLYDVLQKARFDHAMACRLSWTRRLLMALDAARGMLYLHSHKPIILHRDLKSPNLFVTNALHVKVGDFNLSRHMALGSSFVKSSLEINPRWNAPEVIGEGYYSTAADVYAFGIVLWELLTWQEPWEEEGLGSFQIMIAVQQQQQRPGVPPLDKLPGQLGPAEAVAGYLKLMQDCWAQAYTLRPGFDVIVTRLKALLRMAGPNATAGPAATQQRSSFEGALPPVAEVPAPTAAAAAAAGQRGHQRSKSELVGQAAAAAAAMAGPEIADLLQLDDGDGLPGPTAPAPPAAALLPIPLTTPSHLECSEGVIGQQPVPVAFTLTPRHAQSEPLLPFGAVAISETGSDSASVGNTLDTPMSSCVAAAAADSSTPTAAAKVGAAASSGAARVRFVAPALSPFAATEQQEQQDQGSATAVAPATADTRATASRRQPSAAASQAAWVGQPMQQQQVPSSFGATAPAAAAATAAQLSGLPAGSRSSGKGRGSSPFAAFAAQVSVVSPSTSGTGTGTAAAAAAVDDTGSSNEGGTLGGIAETIQLLPVSESPVPPLPPRSRMSGGSGSGITPGDSPLAARFSFAKPSPFASPFVLGAGSGSSPLVSVDGDSIIGAAIGAVPGSPVAVGLLEAAIEAASAVDATTRAARRSSGSTRASTASGAATTDKVRIAGDSADNATAAAACVATAAAAQAATRAVTAAASVAAAGSADAGDSSSTNGQQAVSPAVLSLSAGVPSVKACVNHEENIASLADWKANSQQQQQQPPTQTLGQPPLPVAVVFGTGSKFALAGAATVAVDVAPSVSPAVATSRHVVSAVSSSSTMASAYTADLITLDSMGPDGQLLQPTQQQQQQGNVATAAAAELPNAGPVTPAVAPVQLSVQNPFVAAIATAPQ